MTAEPGADCRNLYRFIRLCLGDALSDREIARQWRMEWKSFVALKHGRRQMPRLDELGRLASGVLKVNAGFVFQAASGIDADSVAALVARERGLFAALEHVSDAVFTADSHGIIRDVNQGFCDVLGCPVDDVVGRAVAEFIAAGDQQALASALAAALGDGEAGRVVLAFRGAGGEERIVDLRLTRIPESDGRSMGVQALGRDVTTERRLEEQLESERRLLKDIYENVPAACIVFDRDGRILSANAAVDQVCPVPAATMIGRNAVEVFGDPGPAGCPVTRAFVTGRTEQQVSRLVSRNGQTIYVHRSAGPVVHDNRVEQVIEILVDVTEQVTRGDLRVLSLWMEQPAAPLPGASDRRASLRARTSFEALYETGGRRAAARVANLSSGGLFLAAPPAAPDGEPIAVEWTLPGDDSPVRTRGVVAWTRAVANANGPVGVGIRFVAVAPVFASITRSDDA